MYYTILSTWHKQLQSNHLTRTPERVIMVAANTNTNTNTARKIKMDTFKVIKATISGKKAVKIEVVDGTVVVWHYSTKIAVITGNSVKVYTGGSSSLTTKRHINSIFGALGANAHIFSRDYSLYVNVRGLEQVFFDGYQVDF